MAKYRILSLDGGGSWALIQVRALLELFGDRSGHEVLAQFNYAAANSGGSIVLAAMLEGMKLGNILKFFLTESDRQKIFVKLNWPPWVAHPIAYLITGGPRYYAEKKLIGLQEMLPKAGALTLAQVKTMIETAVGQCPQLLITSFDYDRLRSIYFRSDNQSKTVNSSSIEPTTLAEAVHGSSDAPIKYFDLPAEVNTSIGMRRCWDGGLAACNNPVLAALSEVIANQYDQVPGSKASAEIEVLSIGTATVRLPMQDENGTIAKGLAMEQDKPTLIANLKRATTAVLDDPPDAATFTVYTMLRGFQLPASSNPIVRMNPVIQPIFRNGVWTRPMGLEKDNGNDPFVSLVNLDMDAVEQKEVDLIVKLTDAWIKGDVLNQPIRADDNLQCQLGYNTFANAKSAWLAKLGTDKKIG
ncbi:MAG TPA: patatin-like phospholipase family protein [Phycisphaerae bacterium]|nr:patatin-like phospholipase family protein [Phycisphaerae bacterium]